MILQNLVKTGGGICWLQPNLMPDIASVKEAIV